MDENKQTAESFAPSDSDMELINRFTKKSLTPGEVYTFAVILCDNEVDRDFERFDIPALESLAKLFVGKTGIFDHSMSGRDQTSRLYSAQMVTDSTRVTSTGEAYTYIKAMAYMPRTEKNSALIEEIDAGIKKEASVGCAVANVICSECAADLRTGHCEHIKGKNYSGRVCHSILKNPTDAYEWSFVAVPAQKGAGVTKSFRKKEEKNLEDIIKAIKSEENGISLTADELARLRVEFDKLEKQAADGVAYRKSLITETVRMGMLSMPQINGESLGTICAKLSTAELCELKKAFAHDAEKSAPLTPQLSTGANSKAVGNDEFKI